jgi:hypothetical protein
MNHILKSFGTGLLFGLMSFIAYLFGTTTVNAFVAMPSAVGWEAIGLLVAGLLMGFMTLFIIFCLGAIPLGTIEELRSKLKEQEEDAARDYEALYKAATYDYQHKGVEK